MPRRLTPADPDAVAAALVQWRDRDDSSGSVRLLVKHYLALLQEHAPGSSVEVRVPPYAAVQVVEGVRHTRGTPPAVVELSADVWIELATGELSWADAEQGGRIQASGERADLTPYLPLEA